MTMQVKSCEAVVTQCLEIHSAHLVNKAIYIHIPHDLTHLKHQKQLLQQLIGQRRILSNK